MNAGIISEYREYSSEYAQRVGYLKAGRLAGAMPTRKPNGPFIGASGQLPKARCDTVQHADALQRGTVLRRRNETAVNASKRAGGFGGSGKRGKRSEGQQEGHSARRQGVCLRESRAGAVSRRSLRF